MSTTFMTSPKLMFTSESVTEGHPDKLCDQVSDAVLDACLTQDPTSRVACETATKTGFVMVLGEITTQAFVNFDDLIRKVVNDIGYDNSDKGFDGHTCAVQVTPAPCRWRSRRRAPTSRRASTRRSRSVITRAKPISTRSAPATRA